MFLGNFTHTIDVKGRLSIPVKFREPIHAESSGTVFITSELDPCLAAYTRPEWNRLLDKVQNLPGMNTGVRDYRRLLYSRVSECTLDKQGRILIPQKLREYAGLKGDTYLVGNNNKIEIWNPHRWDEAEARALEGAPEIQKELARLGM
ncbi:MAG: division/cell wall cluster transcriptional repressor MraZ [Nitrospiria bacterium]